MRSQAYFQEIREKLIEQLQIAQTSIVVAVAWFTDRAIFQELIARAAAGVNVQVMLGWDQINQRYSPDFSILERLGGEVIKIVTADPNAVMHNKFCVIDAVTIVSGSYSWTKKAAGNNENITVTWDAPVLARQFLDEFERLRVRYSSTTGHQAGFDFIKVNQRLQLIRNYIGLNEFAEISAQVAKIRVYELPAEVSEIINFLDRSYYSDALAAMDRLQARYMALSSQDHDRTFRLRMELRYLDLEHTSLLDYHEGLRRTIHDFRLRVRLAINDLLRRLLDVKIEWARSSAKAGKAANYEKIKEEYRQFEQEQRADQEAQKTALSEDEEREIRELYRKGVKLCHPDKVDPARQEQAKQVFIRLKQAFDDNDLAEVRRLLQALEAGTWDFGPAPTDAKEADKLEAVVQELRLKIELLRQQIVQLGEEEDYAELSEYPSVEAYILDKENILKKEILHYEEQINAQKV